LLIREKGVYENELKEELPILQAPIELLKSNKLPVPYLNFLYFLEGEFLKELN
jgi:hypothetical protein